MRKKPWNLSTNRSLPGGSRFNTFLKLSIPIMRLSQPKHRFPMIFHPQWHTRYTPVSINEQLILELSAEAAIEGQNYYIGNTVIKNPVEELLTPFYKEFVDDENEEERTKPSRSQPSIPPAY